MGKRGPLVNLRSERTEQGRNKFRSWGNLGRAKCPKWLREAAKAHWRALAPKLERHGALTKMDQPCFELLCTIFARCQELDARITQDGLLVPGPKGQMIPHPALGMLARHARIYSELAAKFGLTPISRERLWPILERQRAEQQFADESDELEKYFLKN